MVVSRKRVHRLMRIMGLRAIYRGTRTSRMAPEHRICPYLSRAERNQAVWRSKSVSHWHDEKEPSWEPVGVRSGAGVSSSGVSQESSGSSEIWEVAFSRLCRRR